MKTDVFLVLEYYNLKYKEKGEDRFLNCVFHNDKTASLSCHKERGFHCFGCGNKGDAVTFIEKYLNISNKEAFKIYCSIANISFDTEYKQTNIKTSYEILTTPQKLLQHCEKVKEPTDYLRKRGITTVYNVPLYIVIRDFVATIKDKEEKIYKGALVIPIYNKKGVVISAQYIYELKKDIKEGKDNFKGFLYDHSYKTGFTKFFVNDKENFFLVEGVFDALSLNVAGFNAIWCINAEELLNCALNNFEDWIHKGYVFADNDEIGIEKGTKASSILNTPLIKSNESKFKDVNDILKHKGEKYLRNLINNFLEDNFYATLDFLIKNNKLKMFYNKYDSNYIIVLFNEVICNSSRENIGFQIINKLQKEKVIFYKSSTVKRIATAIGNYVAHHCDRIDDVNYHPKYKSLEAYEDKETEMTFLNIYKESGLHKNKELKKYPFPTIYKHLVHITGKEEYANWLIQLLAWKWQKPYVKYAYIPIFIGKQGTGKGMFVDLLKILFGNNTNKDVTNNDFEERFNSAFENKLFCVCDEAINADNRMKTYNKIKALTGSDSYALENKGIRKKDYYRNFNTIILISNNEYIYPIEGEDDRRAIVFKQYELLDKEHLNIMDKMRKGKSNTEELIGFAYHLAHLKLEDRLNILVTEARQELKDISKSFIEEFIDDLSANYKDVITEVNHICKLDLPTINEVTKESDKNGFYIKVEDNVLMLSTNMFLIMLNKKYSSNAKNNKFVYSTARRNPKFNYEIDNQDFFVYSNRKKIRVVKIQLTSQL